jgi:hypothetical protein
MKHLVTILATFFIAACTFAQTGIGTTTPHASAQLEVSSTTKGFLPPRLTTEQLNNIANPATGLVIYNTTTNILEYKTASGWISYQDNQDGTNAGEMQYWDGSTWVTIAPGNEGQVLKYINNAPAWGTVEASVPDAPIIGTAIAGNAQATISFTAPAFNGYSTITSYIATASPEGYTGTASQSDDGSLTVTGLSNGTTYTFAITATNAIGTSQASANSNPITTPNGVSNAPISVTALAGDGVATISYTAPDNNGGSSITSYTATSSPGGFTGTVLQSGDDSIPVTGLSNLINYTFTVTANNIFGESTPSDPSNAVTPSEFPVLAATTISNIGWVAATANGSVSNDSGIDLIAKGICWSTNQNPSIVDSKSIESGEIGDFTSYITGLSPSTTYYVRPYATNANGTVYGTEISFTTTATKTIGDSHEGGLIAYFLTSTDSGYDSNYPHGLIAYTTDLSTGIEWGCATTEISGSFSNTIGAGLQNTINIVNECNTPANSATLSYDLISGIFDDWYLPSTFELVRLYSNIGPGGTNIGGFSTTGQYWSSTQRDVTLAGKVNFSNGNSGFQSKSVLYRVRPIRSF